jgi:hypothetical protein
MNGVGLHVTHWSEPIWLYGVGKEGLVAVRQKGVGVAGVECVSVDGGGVHVVGMCPAHVGILCVDLEIH